MDQQIFSDVDNYINDLFTPEDEHLRSVVPGLYSINSNMPEASVSANQGKFLQLMATLCNAKNVLELGTLGGYSTIWLARALPDGGKVVSIEFNEAHAALARAVIERAGLSHKVDIRVGKCIDILPAMVSANEGSFDMVFIDADKPPYTEYFDYALQLSRKGTLIIADNVVRDGRVLDEHTTDEAVKGVRRFNEMLASHPGVLATIIQTIGIKTYDGMALAVVR